MPEHQYAMPEGLADDPVAVDVASLMHGAGLPLEDGDAALDWLSAGIPAEFAGEIDEQTMAATFDELADVWGKDLEPNMARLQRYIERNLPDGLADRFTGATTSDGRPVFMNASTLMRLHAIASRAPEMPASTGNLDRDIAAIENIMGESREAYFRDQGLQLRLKSLYEQRLTAKQGSGS